MKRLLLAIILLCLASCQECYADYTIVTRDRIEPPFITVMGVGKLETVPNPGTLPAYPATVKRLVYKPANFDPYSADPLRRSELWEDDYGVASSEMIFATFPGIRDWQAQRIRTEGTRRLEALTPYSPAERDTWPQQQAEAVDWRVNSQCTCTMIRQIAAVRGITLESLVAKIEENIALYPAAAGAILGQQQRLLDRIDAATDIDYLLAITWP